jgi:hypothetical protein
MWRVFPRSRGLCFGGTSGFNFAGDLLENPPRFDPTRCSRCEKIIKLDYDGYPIAGGRQSTLGIWRNPRVVVA